MQSIDIKKKQFAQKFNKLQNEVEDRLNASNIVNIRESRNIKIA